MCWLHEMKFLEVRSIKMEALHGVKEGMVFLWEVFESICLNLGLNNKFLILYRPVEYLSSPLEKDLQLMLWWVALVLRIANFVLNNDT